MKTTEDKALTVAQTAERLGVCERTVRRWIEAERLKAAQPAGRGGRVLVPLGAVEALLGREVAV